MVPTTRGLGVACAIGVVVAAAFVLVVLPAALVLFGRWVFWPRVPHVGRRRRWSTTGSLWRRVGDPGRPRRPAAFVAGTLVLLAVMALGLLPDRHRASTRPTSSSTSPEAISAAERLAESFPAGTSDPRRCSPATTPTRCWPRSRTSTACPAAPVTASRATAIAQIDAVLDGDARQRRGARTP